MLPPPPPSRQASYAYSLPRPTRSTSFAPGHSRRVSGYESVSGRTSHGDEEGDEDEVEDGDFEERLAAEEVADGGSAERGLEETLEKLGFGMFPWHLPFVKG